jgi:hypothetical protein
MSKSRQKSLKLTWLIAGDLLTLLLVTIFGFASHESLETGGTRMLTTFIPLLAAWFMVAPFIGVYQLKWATSLNNLWRPFWAMVLAAPMAAWIRGVWLGTPVIPIFVLVLGGVSALGILAWRLIFCSAAGRSRAAHG